MHLTLYTNFRLCWVTLHCEIKFWGDFTKYTTQKLVTKPQSQCEGVAINFI